MSEAVDFWPCRRMDRKANTCRKCWSMPCMSSCTPTTRLEGVKTSPFYFQGQLVTMSGFHAPSGFYCQMPDDWETDLGVAECVNRLDDLLGEFPYVQESDRANILGLLVGQPLKPFYLGPMGFIDKPTSQTGATILARTICLLSDGREPEVFTASTRPRKRQEIDLVSVQETQQHYHRQHFH